ncbi:SDR family NAD(P)-dependent oxidoreductase [Paraburkholderia ginsengisoli]|uniref:SDR family NAD(P)-dependent oxidoreductase n=1 Tax=Paraburkholderia ginsengisoli TaxID=311231 RepID=UPI001E2B8AD0|nr:SDR family NAD(P)-dependent oxidoreductase [Paraburkholderia ginsengisoli]
MSSSVGSLTANSDPAFAYRAIFGPVYPASKTALNALTVAMAIELEPEGISVNAVSPGFTSTNLNGYAGAETVEEGAREAVLVARLGAGSPTGRLTRRENKTIPVVMSFRAWNRNGDGLGRVEMPTMHGRCRVGAAPPACTPPTRKPRRQIRCEQVSRA